MSTLEAVQKKLSQEITKFSSVQKTYQKSLQQRQQLDAQLNENNLVKQEFDLLDEGAITYKQIGPVLMKIDKKEALENVNARIKYITSEIKRHDTTLQDLDKQQDQLREGINKLQQQLQQAQVKAAAFQA